LPTPASKAAVTGGAGFLGGALVARLIAGGWAVTALARDARKFKAQPGLDLVVGDLANRSALMRLAEDATVFFHLAGVTHARRDSDYETVNVEGAARAAEAAAAAGAPFIHISSLSARLPDISPYARSKKESEAIVAKASGRNRWTVLRLPAIYGPRDHATLPYFKLLKSGFALEPKTVTPARASLLYVDDAAAAVTAAKDAPHGEIYEVGDDSPDGHSWTEIGETLAETFGKKARPLRAPRFVVSPYFAATRRLERMTGRAPSIRAGQVGEFFHPDWVAKENLFQAASSWRPETPLKEGFAKTVLWYQENGLL